MPAFLFTDIESSTLLWEEQPDEMGSALARHDQILREVVEEFRGRIIKTTGDGIFAVFDTAPEAVRASVSSQLALGRQDWPTAGPIRVRMGVHVGEGEMRDDDYFGPVLNRAARIMAAGHGGQILLSRVAASLTEGSLPEGTSLRDLGTHRLKDLTRAEHLYQLVHDSLPTEFPPPATLDARPHNLPVQISEFFGRDRELASIQAILADANTHLLTLTGPGGAGKTRLGLQVAAEQAGHFEDGVFFVDLSAETDPDTAFETVVRTLDLPVSEGHPLKTLKARLRDRELLLMLDNLEQLMEMASGIVELVQHCPELKVLVTSREPLRVRAEKVFPVPALSLADSSWPLEAIAEAESVRLFADRARSVRPDFSLNEGNAPVLAEICRRLDGLPLAIELAAARLNLFSPEQLMDRLRGRLDVLGTGVRDLPARQRTLWGAIGWSYELLDDFERRLFEMMSVFSPTDLTAVETVGLSVLGGGAVLDSLASLIDKSLIRSEDHGGSQRFAMLQTIREYAAERLAASGDLEEETRRAHAAYFSDYARSLERDLSGEGRSTALEDLTLAIGNLATAWRYWVDRGDAERVLGLIDVLWALHDAKGWYHAAIGLAGDALDVLASSGTPESSTDEELALRTSLARALMAVQGYTVEVEEAFKQVLELAQQTGEATQVFPVLRALATYYLSITDFDKSAELGRQLLELAEREKDESILIDGHYVFGAATAFGGDLETGLPHLERAIELFDPNRHGSGRFRLGPSPGVVARVASGLLLWQCGALRRAVARVDEALELARVLQHPFSLAYALYHNGLLQVYRGRFGEGKHRADELGRVAAENDYRIWTTLSSVLAGVSLAGLGRLEEGLALTEVGVDLYLGLTTPPIFWPMILGLRAVVFKAAGRPERGLELIDEAIEANGSEDAAGPDLFVIRGDVLGALDDTFRAEQAYQLATRKARAGGLRLIELQAMTRLVRLRRNLGLEADGSDELASLLGQFADGMDEHDVKAATELLPVASRPATPAAPPTD